MIRGSVQAIADMNNGMVPRAFIRDAMRKAPQLARDEPFRTKFAEWGAQHGSAEAIPVKEVQALLAKAEKTAHPANSYLMEIEQWEARQTATTVKARPKDPVTGRTTGVHIPVGEARIITTSRMAARARNNTLRATSLTDVQARRGEARVQAFQDALGPGLDRAGYDVAHVSEAIEFSPARN
jgi:hypothetical protein